MLRLDLLVAVVVGAVLGSGWAVVLGARSAAAICFARAATSAWLVSAEEFGEVGGLGSTRFGTGGQVCWCCWCSAMSARRLLLVLAMVASSCENLVSMLEWASVRAEFAMPASWRVACSSQYSS